MSKSILWSLVEINAVIVTVTVISPDTIDDYNAQYPCPDFSRLVLIKTKLEDTVYYEILLLREHGGAYSMGFTSVR